MSGIPERARWRLRRLRPLARAPVVWWRHRGLSPDDVILAEYPKSGSTWLAFLLIDALCGATADFGSATRLVPPVGAHGVTSALVVGRGRLLRTHERHRREYGRAVYLVRHVNDVAVSYYHWLTWLAVDPMPFKAFLEEFLRGRVDPYGPWARHVRSWTESTGEPPLIVRYEDLHADTAGSLHRVLEFLGAPVSVERVEAAVESNTLERMRAKQEREREGVFRDRAPDADFVRRGIVGDSNDWLDDEDLRLVERYAGPTLERLGYSLRSVPG